MWRFAYNPFLKGSCMEIDLVPSKYTLISTEYVPDCRGTGYLLRHKKSGARISVIANDDPNKSFCIAFRTPPKDNTGVAHILEHSVLCGSRKFRAKDPFMELAKGSLNTYLNALTYPDKTCYPVASCNAQDFANLMDVYLDAVFYPAIYEKEEIFKQEGWHYEIDEDDGLDLNGIVYSEMKGAFSSPEERLARRTMKAIFPDNAYAFESGGDPDVIPTLTYEDFLAFHKKYYHPSNSYISLYGDMDVTERLEFLDREYLSAFDGSEETPRTQAQKPIGEQYGEDLYPLADDDPEEDASLMNWAFMLSDSTDIKTNTALGIVCQVLFDITGAPVKEALVKKGLGKEISFLVEDEIRQPFGTLSVRNIDADKFDEVKKTVREALLKAVEEGLNRRSLESALTRLEFSYSEEDFGTMPKGLVYIFRSLGTWLYDDNAPFVSLNVRSCFDDLRAAVDTGYYENLVREYMLNPKTSAWCVLKPKKGLDREEDLRLAGKLREYRDSLSKDELDAIKLGTERLKEYQQAPSTPEEMLTVPMLRREDIDRKGFVPVNEELEICGVPSLLHDIETNGIFYIDAIFEVNGLEKDEIPYLGLMLRLLGSLDTKNYSYLELDNECGIHTGGICASVATYPLFGTKEYRPLFSMSGKAFARESAALMRLLAEVLFETDFSSIERVREVIREHITDMRGVFTTAGHRVAMAAARSAISGGDAFTGALSGRGNYDLLCRLDSASDREIADAIARGKGALRKIIRKRGLWFNITSTREIFDSLREGVSEFLKKVGEFEGAGESASGIEGKDSGESAPEIEGKGAGESAPGICGSNLRPEGRGPQFETRSARVAYKSASDVNYVALAGIHECTDAKEAGHFCILSSILSNEYLWNNIRVLGGAYGCGFSFRRNVGSMAFYSYRDPSIGRTLEVFEGTAEYIRNFDVDEREMTKFIIGTVGILDTPMTPDMKGRFSFSAYMCDIDAAWVNDRRSAILDAGCENIRALADTVQKVLDLKNFCVVGNESDIEEENALFEKTYNLF